MFLCHVDRPKRSHALAVETAPKTPSTGKGRRLFFFGSGVSCQIVELSVSIRVKCAYCTACHGSQVGASGRVDFVKGRRAVNLHV